MAIRWYECLLMVIILIVIGGYLLMASDGYFING
jgi:hypothetical protein